MAVPCLDAKGNLIAIISKGEFHILKASTSNSLRILLEKSVTVSSNEEELFSVEIERAETISRARGLCGATYSG